MSVRRFGVTIRGVFHSSVAVLTWILFFYWWRQVIPQASVDDVSVALLAIFLTTLCTSVLTLLWIRHNVAIFRRKGPRKALPSVSEERTDDHLGRKLDHPGTDRLKSASVVFVSRKGDRKHFEIPQKV